MLSHAPNFFILTSLQLAAEPKHTAHNIEGPGRSDLVAMKRIVAANFDHAVEPSDQTLHRKPVRPDDGVDALGSERLGAHFNQHEIAAVDRRRHRVAASLYQGQAAWIRAQGLADPLGFEGDIIDD